MKRVETRIISAAMCDLAKTIQCDDGVANAACAEAALRLDEQTVEIRRLKERLQKCDSDDHFFVKDIANRLPGELLPEKPTWSAMLSAVTMLKTERNNAIAESERLRDAIKGTIEENLHLADGEICTLIKLKRAINYDDLYPPDA